MASQNWKKCRKCGRKQSIRHISSFCGKCEASERKRAGRESRKRG